MRPRIATALPISDDVSIVVFSFIVNRIISKVNDIILNI